MLGYQAWRTGKGRGIGAGPEARSVALVGSGCPTFWSRRTRKCPVRSGPMRDATNVAFRFVPEWTLIDLNGLTGPHWSGKYTLAPEKYGIGPEKLRGEWSRE
jgi:hypothetical protein